MVAAVSGVPRSNDVYSGMRLLYERGFEPAFLERRTSFQLIRILIACIFVGLMAGGLAGAFIFVSALLVAQDLAKATLASGLVGSLVYLGVSLAWSFRRHRLGIASWQVVVDDRAGSAGSAVDHLREELGRRLGGTGALQAEIERRGRWAVRIRHRTFTCYVSVFPYGSDLFVGWAMLEEPHFWNIVGGWLADLFHRSWFDRELRSYIPKALRDAVHNSTREAVAAAAGGKAPAPALGANTPPPSPPPQHPGAHIAPLPGQRRLG